MINTMKTPQIRSVWPGFTVKEEQLYQRYSPAQPGLTPTLRACQVTLNVLCVTEVSLNLIAGD